MAIANADGSIYLTTKVDTSGINKGMASIKSTVAKIGAAVGVAFGVSALVNFGKAAINLASDLQEVQNVVDVAFGDMAYRMEEFADTAIETFGISELTAKQTGSSFMAMAKGMQFADKVASDMALTLTGLSADMASFYNISQSEAKTALSAVYTGETETLKRYGILITEVNLQEFARQKGITKSINAMTQQEKVMLRYEYILKSTQLAQGDFIRTQDSWANQTRILAERWKEMQAIFGDAFMMLGTLVLPLINDVVSGLTEIARYAKATVQMFTKSAETTEKQNASIDKTVEAQERLTEETEKTAEAQKKILANFDEIQILASEIAEGETENKQLDELPEMVGATNYESRAEDLENYANKVREVLGGLADYIPSVLAAVGLLLLATGHIVLGAGFLFAGATMYGVREKSPDGKLDTEAIKQSVDVIKDYIPLALAAIGIILLMLGHIFIGAGFIIAGAVAYGVKEAKGNDGDAVADTKRKIAQIAEDVSLALSVIGLILIFTGHILLGLGFVIAGAKTLGITEANEQKGAVTEKIQEFVEENRKAIDISGAALMVLGLLIMGVTGKFGIGLSMVAGGAGLLYTAATISGEDAKEAVKRFIEDNRDEIEKTGIALVVLGTLILPVKFAAGLAMLATGAAMKYSAVAEEGNTIKQHLRGFIDENWGQIQLSGAGLIVLGALLISGGHVAAGMAMLAAGATAMYVGIPESTQSKMIAAGQGNKNASAQREENAAALQAAWEYYQKTHALSPTAPTYEAFAQEAKVYYGDAVGNAQNSTVPIIIEIDGKEFGRAVVELGGEETRRYGGTLAQKNPAGAF